MAKQKRSEPLARVRRSSLTPAQVARETKNAAAAMAILNGFQVLEKPADEYQLSWVRAILASLQIAPEPDPEILRSVRAFRESLNVSLADLEGTLGVPVNDLQRLEDLDISFFSVTAMKRWLYAIRALAKETEDVTPFLDVTYSVLSSSETMSRPALAASADEIIEDDSLVSARG